MIKIELNKFINLKKLYVLSLLFVFLSLIFLPRDPIEAANCGGAVVCACGDTIVENYTLPDDLICPKGPYAVVTYGLIIGANDLIIDGNNHSLIGSLADYDVFDGANLSVGFEISNYNNITIKNFDSIKNFKTGLNFLNSINNTIVNNGISLNIHGLKFKNSSPGNSSSSILNNIIDSNYYGVSLENSNGNSLVDNIINFNSNQGIYIYKSNNNTISGNTLKSNANAIYLGGESSQNSVEDNNLFNNTEEIKKYTSENNTYSSNRNYHNLKTRMISFNEIPRIVNINQEINFSASIFDLTGNACSDCSYEVSTSPNENISNNKINNIISGSFTPTKNGLYSLVFKITDQNNNTTERRFIFLVGETNSATKRFYFLNDSPTHGQPVGADARSLSSTLVSSLEEWSCSSWVQNALDEIPYYPLATLSGIDTNFYYSSEFDGSIGAERINSYSEFPDISSFIPQTVIDYDLIYNLDNSNFTNLDWAMDYLSSWYNFTMKLNGGNIYMKTEPQDPSYIDLTYKYPANSIIKSISNDDTVVMSATTSLDSGISSFDIKNPIEEEIETTIIFENFNKPFLNNESDIYADKTNILDLNIGADEDKTINSVSMEILLSSGSARVLINNWENSGDSNRNWSESYSTTTDVTHTIWQLEPNKSYNFKMDGLLADEVNNSYCQEGVCMADSQGQIIFTQAGLNSTHTFNLESVPERKSSGGSRLSFVPNNDNLEKEPENVGPVICPTGHSFSVSTGEKCTTFIKIETDVKRNLKLTLPRMSGEDVKILQAYLNNYNLMPMLVVDGIFGQKTKMAVIAFQKKNNLKPDGVVGPITREILLK